MIIFNNKTYSTGHNDSGISLFRIERGAYEVLYFIDKISGFGFNGSGRVFSFSLDGGNIAYFNTKKADRETFKREYEKEKKYNWKNVLLIL